MSDYDELVAKAVAEANAELAGTGMFFVEPVCPHCGCKDIDLGYGPGGVVLADGKGWQKCWDCKRVYGFPPDGPAHE